MDIHFSTMEVEWDSHTMPFKKHGAMPLDTYHIRDSELMSMAKDRVKEILDTMYEPANLEKVCTAQSHLLVEQQQKLLALLNKYGSLFNGTLGTWHGTEVNLELKEGATPYHARPYPIPKCHLDTLKMEVE